MSNFSNYLFTAFHRDRRAGKIFNFGEKLPHFPNKRACSLNIFEKKSTLLKIFHVILSGSVWLRQPVEDLRFDLGILFYGFTRWSWTIPTLRKSPFVIRAPVARCAAVAVR